MPLPTDEEIAKARFWKRLVALMPTTVFPTLVAIALGAGAALVSDYLGSSNPQPQRIEVYEGNLVSAQNNVKFALDLLSEIKPQLTGEVNTLPGNTSKRLDDLTSALTKANSALEAARIPEFAAPSALERLGESVINLIFPKAGAQETQKQARETTPLEYMRQGVAAFMIVAISLLLFVFLFVYFKTEDTEKIKFSQSMIQMILGFYIGVVTAVLGIPN